MILHIPSGKQSADSYSFMDPGALCMDRASGKLLRSVVARLPPELTVGDVVVGVGILRVDRDRPAVVLLRTAVLLLLVVLEEHAQVAVGVGMLRVDLNLSIALRKCCSAPP